MMQQFLNWLESHESAWFEQWKRYNDIAKTDAWETQVALFLTTLQGQIEGAVFVPSEVTSGVSFRAYVDRLADLFLVFNAGQFAKQLEALLGESFFGGTEWWKTVKAQWVSELEKRARGTAEDIIERLKSEVYQSVRNNVPFSQIMNKIKSIASDMPKARAEFLARDLGGSLNYVIQRFMQEDVGVTMYTWLTQADERVRGKPGGLYPNAPRDHWMMDGLLCKWTDPLVFSQDGTQWTEKKGKMPLMHPGQDYSCRCVAQPSMERLVLEVDKEIYKELRQ
jgi:hypothetical protein